MLLIPDYHLQFTFGMKFGSVSSAIKIVQKFRVVLVVLERARAVLRVDNQDPIPTLDAVENSDYNRTTFFSMFDQLALR